MAEYHLKMQIWKYNDKCYLTVNEHNFTPYGDDTYNEDHQDHIESIDVKRYHPYIMGLTFDIHEFEKNRSHQRMYHFSN